MDTRVAHEKLEAWYRALNARRFDELKALIEDITDPDVVLEYPQSGERIRGRANNFAVLENYPGLPDATLDKVHGSEDKWVLTPSWTPLRISGSGNEFTVEGRLVYPNGETWSFVDLFELKDDRLIKVTEYFAAPFPPAEWRAQWVEKA